MRYSVCLILILFVFLSASLCAEEIEIYPDWLSVSEEIEQIANLEMTIENSLRDDKHDKTVQIDIDESIARMEKLIKDAEEIEEDSDDSNRKHDLLVMKGKRERSLRRPPRVTETDPKANVAYDHRDDGEWARLPRSLRREIVQTYAKELPPLWRKRIEAYFLSINVEDSKESPKKAKP